MVHGVFGGAVIGMVAIKFPEILGVGYALIESILGGGAGDALLLQAPAVEAQLLVLIVVKIVATGTSIGSGGAGGIFAPSLFLGSSLGGAFGGIASRLMPSGVMASPSAYALVGMGAVVGATTHAPLTAILIVFELCDHHSIMLPLMLATVIATALAMALHRESIYTEKLVRRGAGSGGEETPSERVLAMRVREVMQPLAATVRPNARLAVIVNQAHAHDTHDVYVVDTDRSVLGVVTMDDVASHVQDPMARRKRLRASTLMRAVATVTAETSIAECMKALEERKHEELPVVDEKMRLIGAISRGDLLAYTSREVLRHEAVLELIDDAAPGHEEIWLADDETRGSVKIGGELVGKSLRELNLRTRYAINVYAIRGEKGSGVPDPDAPLVAGEVLVVVGPVDEVAALRELARVKED
ncbi:MAG: chloride channel protein [Deltaproteobacteria bacterium]|nr:chloride channel protein [Deltaproteobacteria bacterium]